VTAGTLWAWVVPGYLLTVAIEAPILLAGLEARHRWSRRIAAGLWLTAVTYPIVVVALPLLLWPRLSYVAYVAVAEGFAIVVECMLFARVFGGTRRDLWVVAAANVASASAGLAWFGLR
jgi:hypothetical protein